MYTTYREVVLCRIMFLKFRTNQNTANQTQSCRLKQCIIWGLGDEPSHPI